MSTLVSLALLLEAPAMLITDQDFLHRKRMHAMTKADLVTTLHQRLGFTQTRCAELVELILGIITETLEGGEKVKLSGFGSFEVREKRPRRGRNPQTGEEILISERRVLGFKPSPVLRERLNGSGRRPMAG